MSNNTAEYCKLEVQRDELIDKLKRGFVDTEFSQRFQEDLGKLESILDLIHPE
jgi:uncharacterized protein YutD